MTDSRGRGRRRERALQLDPELADAHVTLALGGAVLSAGTGKTRNELFQQAIALNPKLASVRAFFALMLVTAGRLDEALEQAQTGAGARPAVAVRQHVASPGCCHFAGRCEEAIADLTHQRAIMRADGREEAGNILIVAYEVLGQYEEAAALAARPAALASSSTARRCSAPTGKAASTRYWRERLAQMDRWPTCR